MANKYNGSSNKHYSTSKPIEARCGIAIAEVVPTKSSSSSYQTVTKHNAVDKQTGNYGNYTKTETVSTGQIHREPGKGAVGVRDEYKQASTYKVGNKTGYTEYYKEERVREVSYDNSLASNSKNGVVSKAGGSYSWANGYDSGYDSDY